LTNIKAIQVAINTANKTAGLNISLKDVLELYQYLEKYIHNQTHIRNAEYISSLLYCAKEDYKAAKLLSKEKIWSLSVYHLQQAVEKISKGYGLYLGIIKKNDLYGRKKEIKGGLLTKLFRKNDENKTISHITPRTFFIFLNNMEKVIDCLNKCNYLKKKINKSDIDKLKKYIERKPERLAKMDKNEIYVYLELCKKFIKIDKNVDIRQLRKTIKKFKIDLLKNLKKVNLPEHELNSIDRNLTYTHENIDKIIKLFGISGCIFILSVITYPHFSYTRYPDGKLKPTDYKPGLGIVDSLDKIFIILGNIIKNFDVELEKHLKRVTKNAHLHREERRRGLHH